MVPTSISEITLLAHPKPRLKRGLSEAASSVCVMAKTISDHRCRECDWTTPRWVGRCGRCKAWGTVEAVASPKGGITTGTRVVTAVPMSQVPSEETGRIPTGMSELDRVLGGGVVPGAVVLLGGEPGVGKSTLLLEVAHRWASDGLTSLYVSAEESAAQVRMRADRTGAVSDQLFVATETSLPAVVGQIEQVSPKLLVLDSVQTVSTGDGVPGSVSQVREVTTALVRIAKQRGLTVFIVGHVTKDGTIAGPRTLEHLVDVVLSFEGERSGELRLIRASKNRFGPSDELGCFTMSAAGMVEVPDPSGLFVSNAPSPAPGSTFTVSLAGRRPLVGEIQALVAPSPQQTARGVAQGVDSARLSVLLAVLQRRAGIKLHNRDVYVSTVGGARLTDPADDLAVALAVASAAGDWLPTDRVAAFGEVGLSGELRAVPALQRRLAEAARLGINWAIVPKGSAVGSAPFPVVEANNLASALGQFWERCVSTVSTGLTLPGV